MTINDFLKIGAAAVFVIGVFVTGNGFSFETTGDPLLGGLALWVLSGVAWRR